MAFFVKKVPEIWLSWKSFKTCMLLGGLVFGCHFLVEQLIRHEYLGKEEQRLPWIMGWSMLPSRHKVGGIVLEL